MQEVRLRLVTLNCLFRNRPRARLRVIGRMLKEMRPDVACLQEIFFRANVGLLVDDHPTFRPWGASVLGGLVTLPGDAVQGWTFETFRTSIWFERLARKGFLTTRLNLRGERLTVVNTHLVANYDEDWALDNRYARLQLDELQQLGDAILGLPETEPVVVAGDFNIPTSSPQFQEFMQRCGLLSALEWSAVPAGGHGFREIDNVLYRPPGGRPMTAAATLCFQEPVPLEGGRLVHPSDHAGVLAELTW